jgi:hypothetical protein
MPSEDRERSFEKALASHLRAGSSPGDLHGACSDTETLAAYHERSLAPELMASLKAHVADCARCKQILAHLESTEEIPAVAPVLVQQATAAATSSVPVLHARKPTLWRWVAPAGAVAAALLVWVAVHEDKRVRILPPGTSAGVKQAETTATATLTAPSPVLPSRTRDAKKETRASDALTLNPASSSQAASASKPPAKLFLKQKDSSSAGEKSFVADDSAQTATNSLSPEAAPVPEEALQSRSELAQRVDTAKAAAAKIEAENKAANAMRDALSAGTRQQPARPHARSALASAPPAAPSPPEQAFPVPAGASGDLTRKQEMAGTSKFTEKATIRLANSIGAVTISAPGGLVSWRGGQGGVIEFSSDAGKTWTLQPSGVTTALLGGSAPSDKICWFVGSAGTILRTTDGGAHWQKLPPPVQEDILTIAALDARRATVSLANDSYETSDGGATWNKLAPE